MKNCYTEQDYAAALYKQATGTRVDEMGEIIVAVGREGTYERDLERAQEMAFQRAVTNELRAIRECLQRLETRDQ